MIAAAGPDGRLTLRRPECQLSAQLAAGPGLTESSDTVNIVGGNDSSCKPTLRRTNRQLHARRWRTEPHAAVGWVD
jgi:hypothetical protein